MYFNHGARYDPIEPGKLDRGGTINNITPRKTTSKNATGMATSGYLVEVERVDIEELGRRYPEPFERKYDPASGLCFNSWIEESDDYHSPVGDFRKVDT